MTAPCPPADGLVGFASGRLTEAEAGAVEAHIDACGTCRAALSGLARGDAPPSFGRYRLDTVLGAGGMGLVYRAWDPQLARAVAIKVVRAAGSDEAGRARLVREAQSLARLSHPNVCHVYDVGRDGDEVWVAMELIDGVTLREHATAAPLPLLRGAAEGIAAAHAAGLVHRDVKPENVLVTRDGRAIVTDFGLARGGAGERAPGIGDPLVTATGAVAGTPAYLAPEQLTGGPVDARADQFAWAVMAWELLTGARPFTTALDTRLAEIRAGVARPAGLAPALGAALARALAADPDARFPSMLALIDALDAPTRASRWPLGLAAGLAAVAVVGYALWPTPTPAAAVAPPVVAAQPPPPVVPVVVLPPPTLTPPAPTPVPVVTPAPAPRPHPAPVPAARPAAAADFLPRPQPRGTAIAVLQSECLLPVDPAHPDPALRGQIADWGRVTRVEAVTVGVGGADWVLPLVEVIGQRATYRFEAESRGAPIATRVGEMLVVCVNGDADVYTPPPAWAGLVTVLAVPVTAPPRVTELAALAPIHVLDGPLLTAAAARRPLAPPGRNYLVHAQRIGAAHGARFDVDRWSLDVPAGVTGIASDRDLWLVVTDPHVEDNRIVMRAVAALPEMFP